MLLPREPVSLQLACSGDHIESSRAARATSAPFAASRPPWTTCRRTSCATVVLQPQWNGKLLIHHGGNVGVSYGMGNPPRGDIAGTAPEGAELLLGDSITTALGRGFMTLSTAQGNLGHNGNLVTAAESLMMGRSASSSSTVKFVTPLGRGVPVVPSPSSMWLMRIRAFIKA